MKLCKQQYDTINSILLLIIIEGFYVYGIAMELIEYPGWLYTYPYLVLLGLTVVKICLQNNSWKEWLIFAGIICIGFFSWYFSGERYSFLFALIICGCKGADLEKILRVDIVIRWISVILHMILPAIGIVQNNVNVMMGGRPRTFFGWGHPNGMGISFLMICTEWICLRHKKMKWYEYAGILGLVIFLDLTANSRTSEAVIILLLLLEVICIKRFSEEKKELCFWKWISSITLLVSVLLPIAGTATSMILGYPSVEKFGTIGSRFMLTAQFIRNHGFTWFGCEYGAVGCEYIAEQNEYLDMLFANCFLKRGILFGTLVLSLCIMAIWIGVKRKNIKYLLLLFVMLLLGTAEQEHINLIYSVFPVLLGMTVWKVGENIKQ